MRRVDDIRRSTGAEQRIFDVSADLADFDDGRVLATTESGVPDDERAMAECLAVPANTATGQTAPRARARGPKPASEHDLAITRILPKPLEDLPLDIETLGVQRSGTELRSIGDANKRGAPNRSRARARSRARGRA